MQAKLKKFSAVAAPKIEGLEMKTPRQLQRLHKNALLRLARYGSRSHVALCDGSGNRQICWGLRMAHERQRCVAIVGELCERLQKKTSDKTGKRNNLQNT